MKSPLEINKFSSYYHYYLGKEYFFAGHSHKSWEINVVVKGALRFTYDDRVVTLRKNMLMICESDVFHRNCVWSDNGAEIFMYQFYTNHIPHSEKPRVYELDDKNLLLVKLIAEEAEKNASETKPKGLHSNALNYQAHSLLELLLIRLTENENSVDFDISPDEKLYRTAVNYMKENISENICINDIAKLCHVGPTKIKNVFSQYTGEAIMTHFYNMKINTAKKMLGDGMSVGEVSDALGYSSQAYLSAVFKKITGVTPKEFKNSL